MYLGVTEASQVLSVDAVTLRELGEFRVFETEGGQRRFLLSDVQRLAAFLSKVRWYRPKSFDTKLHRVLRTIRLYGKITRGGLRGRTALRAFEIDEIVAQLLAKGCISAERVKTGTKPATLYSFIQDWPE